MKWNVSAVQNHIRYHFEVVADNHHAARMAAVNVCHNYWPRSWWHIEDIVPTPDGWAEIEQAATPVEKNNV